MLLFASTTIASPPFYLRIPSDDQRQPFTIATHSTNFIPVNQTLHVELSPLAERDKWEWEKGEESREWEAGGLERSEGAKAMKEGEGGKVKVKIKPKV